MKLLFGLIILVLSWSSFALDEDFSFEISDKNLSYMTGSYYQYIGDKKLSYENALYSWENSSSSWVRHKKVKRIFSSVPVWYRFSIKNNTNQTVQRVFEYPYPNAKIIEFSFAIETAQL
jgi:hypothetical protein